MEQILSVELMRESDAATIAAGTPGRELMERAARGILEAVTWKSPVAIVCGSGNNAGDGYALALLLRERGIACALRTVSDRFSEDGLYFYEKCMEAGVPLIPDSDDLKGYATVVDCIYGTGFHGEVKPDVAEVIDCINNSDGFIVSVDINSGIDGRSGMGDQAVISDLTVSVGSFQPGHFLGRAKDVMRRKVNCPIGIEPAGRPFYLLEKEDAAKIFPERLNLSNKGTYGYLTLIGGSAKYGGAIRLAYLAGAAMRAGAGVVTAAVPASIARELTSHILESTIAPLPDRDGEIILDEAALSPIYRRSRVIAFGMGVGRSAQTAEVLSDLLRRYDGTLIIDADGLSDLADLGNMKAEKADVVVTPHVKEFSRMTGLEVAEILANPIPHACRYAREQGAIVLLKGPTTIVTDGEEVLLTDRGCPGMATAGSGDVLSGILAAVLACNIMPATEKEKMGEPAGERRRRLLYAVAGAAYVNGLAGELAQREYGAVSMIASDTVAALPKAILSITE